MKQFKKIAAAAFTSVIAVFVMAGLDWFFGGQDRFLHRLLRWGSAIVLAVVFAWLIDRVSRRNSAAQKVLLLGGILFAFYSWLDWRNFRSNLLLASIAAVLWFAFSKWGPPADNVQTLFGNDSRE